MSVDRFRSAGERFRTPRKPGPLRPGDTAHEGRRNVGKIFAGMLVGGALLSAGYGVILERLFTKKEKIPVDPKLVGDFVDNSSKRIIANTRTITKDPITEVEHFSLSGSGEGFAVAITVDRGRDGQIQSMKLSYVVPSGSDKPPYVLKHTIERDSDRRNWSVLEEDSSVQASRYFTTNENDPRLKTDPDNSTILTQEIFDHMFPNLQNQVDTVV